MTESGDFHKQLEESAKKSIKVCDVDSVRFPPAWPKEGTQLTNQEGQDKKYGKNEITYKKENNEVFQTHDEMRQETRSTTM